MKPALWTGASLALIAAGPAHAESCTKSRDYILTNGGTQPSSAYQSLYKTCLETLRFSNVKDAFILTDGAVAVVPRNDAIGATAGTLAEFCTRFPRSTVHFVERAQLRQVADIGRAVRMSSSTSTPCSKITGSG
jgi:hypothetical protein